MLTIELKVPVSIYDEDGNFVIGYPAGQKLEATDTGSSYRTAAGGIWYHEASPLTNKG